ncbi:MAG: hypothetical protein EBR82_31480 [Caulobacteraceae bacterium]|nr:hypothetical protein [Caulobacteraceae bacterium]
MDIVLNFRGAEYRIPDERAFEVGERVERVATLPEILSWGQSPQFHTMARCFGVLLRAAGGTATDREIHREMMAGFTRGDAGAHFEALNLLVTVLMDGAPENKAGGDNQPEKPEAS